jgi:hypothetical protein
VWMFKFRLPVVFVRRFMIISVFLAAIARYAIVVVVRSS